MTWTAYRWIWRLEAPLDGGMPPPGGLNRGRVYVTARAIWGAVTAELSRSDNKETPPDYKSKGKEIADNYRFTYLFPAEKRGDEYRVWMPRYEEGKGLQWHCQGEQEELSNHDFRRRILTSRPGTAIDPQSCSASDGTLRETECINPWWRPSDGKQEKSEMFLLGYFFYKTNPSTEPTLPKTLFIGGDTRYGLGKISLEGQIPLGKNGKAFRQTITLDKEDPQITSDTVWGHSITESIQTENKKTTEQYALKGSKETIKGWENGRLDNIKDKKRNTALWSPGSFSKTPNIWSIIQKNGFWKQEIKV